MTVLFRNWQGYDFKILLNLNIGVKRAKLVAEFYLLEKFKIVWEIFYFLKVL